VPSLAAAFPKSSYPLTRMGVAALPGRRLERVISVTAIAWTLIGRIDAQGARLEARMDAQDARLDRRIDGLDGRIDGLAARIDGLAARVDGLDAKIDAFGAELGQKIEALGRDLGRRIDAQGRVSTHASIRSRGCFRPTSSGTPAEYV